MSKIRRLLLYVFFFSINFEVWDPFNIGFFSVSKLTGLLYFFSVLPDLKEFLRTKEIERLTIPLWIFFALLSALNFLNMNYISSAFFDFSIFQNIILFIILINHAQKEPQILEKGLLSFAIGSIALSIFYHLGIGVSYQEGRVTLFGDNENTVGIRMCISLTIMSLFITQNNLKLGKWRYFLMLSFPLMLSLMAQTGSRVSFLSFSLIFLVALTLYKTKNVLGKAFIFLIGVVIGVYVWNFLMSSDVLSQRLLQSAQNQDLAGRDVIWKSVLPVIESNPVFGIGETGFALFTMNTFGKSQSPHNVIIEILCYTGVIGLIFYSFFLFQVVKTSFLDYRNRGHLIQLLLLIPVFGLIMSGQILVTKIAWIIFAFAVSTISQKRNIHND